MQTLIESAQIGDQAAMRQIIESQEARVAKEALRWARENPTERDDYMQEGRIALHKAVLDWSPRTQGSPCGFFSMRIRWALYRFRQNQGMIRIPKNLFVERFSVPVCSVESLVGDDGGKTWDEFFPSDDDTEQQAMEHMEAEVASRVARVALAAMNPRQRLDVTRVILDGERVTDVAAQMNLNHRSVSCRVIAGLKSAGKRLHKRHGESYGEWV